MTRPRHEDYIAIEPERMRRIIADAVEQLAPADRAERVRYCQETGEHGVRVQPLTRGWLRLTWGGSC